MDSGGDALVEDSVLGDSLNRYLSSRYSFDRRQEILKSTLGYSPEVWRALGEMGILGAGLPEEFGGSPAEHIPTIMAAFGRALVVEPFVPSVVLAGSILAEAGSDEQKNRYLREIISGQTIWAVAFAEPDSRYNLAGVSLSASPDGEDFVLNGYKSVVLGAPWAGKLLVVARTSGDFGERDGISLVVVDPTAPGVTLQSYPTTDGMRAADIVFSDVRVSRDNLVGPLNGGYGALSRAVDLASAAICAEAVGAIDAVNQRTLEHCRTRIVFDQPLGKFQVVQHRLVDMWIADAHAKAIVKRAFVALDRDRTSAAAAVSAAKVQVAKEATFVVQSAVQLHGAMGITDELDVSHYFRRVTMIGTLFGNIDYHLRRYIAESPRNANTAIEALAQVTDLADLTNDEIAFRDEIRDFYRRNLTDELKRAAEMTMWHMTEFEYGRRWQKILYENGYGSPSWPVEYGGCDWTPRQHMIWAAEQARARPPLVMLGGRTYVGPCIMKFGTEEQKNFFLPRIIQGDDWWTQGYSEPGAGADLAALQLAAESEGDDYILNGSKIWTTFAHNANRIFCLVRTRRGERKQTGITFLLIDMDTPGIEVRPIYNMAGDHDFNEVFFTDVRVPKSRRLGEEDQGWAVARHLLLYEHGAHVPRANMENVRRLGWLREIASLESDGRGGRLIDDPDFSRHLAEVSIIVQAMEFASRETFARMSSGVPPGSADELLYVRSREVGQRLTELIVDAVGYYGAPVQREARRVKDPVEAIGPERAILAMPFYLTQRGATIAGGPNEVHRNNLARHLLRL